MRYQNKRAIPFPMNNQTHLQPPDPAQFPRPYQLIVLLGDRAPLHDLVLQSLCHRAARRQNLAVVAADNHFDAYHLARLARARGFDPAALLPSIVLSRPFTCHQLHQRIATLAAAPALPWHALYIIGLLDTFYDEDVRLHEAQRLLQTTLVHLKQIAAVGLPVLVTLTLTSSHTQRTSSKDMTTSHPRQPGRESFIELVKRAADTYWQPAPAILQQLQARQLPLY